MEALTDKEKAAIALQFLRRVDLKGDEVPAYSVVAQWLESFSIVRCAPEPPKAVQDIKKPVAES